MKRTIKELSGFIISAKDGTKGTVKDFLFDEESWTIRYMVADLGKFLPGRKVLIPRVFLNKTDWKTGEFSVELTKKQIEECPALDEHMPVSREYETMLHDHYGINYYWPLAYTAPVGNLAVDSPPVPREQEPREVIKEEDTNSKLRSFKEVKGYQLECSDKKKGNLKNFIVDDESWQIVYMIVDIGHWYTRSKKVMLAVNWASKINYAQRVISIDLESSELENAPEFDPGEPVNVEYEKNLYDYYGREKVFV